AFLHSTNIIFFETFSQSNILVSELGRCYLADFGLTTTVLQSFSSSTGDSRGSTRWMAPELFYPRYSKPSTSTDMYALGCTILEIITGVLPFSEISSDVAVISHVMNGFHPSCPARRFSDEVWGVVKECWEDSDRRPSIQDFAYELHKHYSRRANEDASSETYLLTGKSTLPG
ncbi:kinase-like domain-containing protein, partial [Rhodocollybia butyracea]